MIIGIDDTGTVLVGQDFYMAMVFVQPSKLNNLQIDFLRWEKRCKALIDNNADELKSTSLTDAMYKDFIKNVALSASNPVYYRGYKITVDQRMLDWGAKQKARYIEQYQAEIPKAAQDGRPKWAKQATTLTGWLRNTPDGMFIKMHVLNHALTDALNNAVGLSAVQEFDHELSEFRVMIDEGFIKDRAVGFWKEVLRSNLISSAAEKPMPWLDTWDDNHPFAKTFIEKSKGSYILFKPEFAKRINFHDSKDELVVRVADIVAGILRKKHIDGWQDDALKDFRTQVSVRGPEVVQYQFTDNWDKPPLPNPYNILRAQ